MIWFNGSDLISPKANNGLLQPRLQDDDEDDEEVTDILLSVFEIRPISSTFKRSRQCILSEKCRTCRLLLMHNAH